MDRKQQQIKNNLRELASDCLSEPNKLASIKVCESRPDWTNLNFFLSNRTENII